MVIIADGRNGTFLIRESQHGGTDCPFTLTLLHDRKVFNVNVRIRNDGKFALGRYKDKEQVLTQKTLRPRCQDDSNFFLGFLIG